MSSRSLDGRSTELTKPLAFLHDTSPMPKKVPNPGDDRSSFAIAAAKLDLAMVLRRYGFFGLDVHDKGEPVSARFRVIHSGLEAIPAAPDRMLVIIGGLPDISGLHEIGVRPEPAGAFLYETFEKNERAAPSYRALLPNISFAGANLTPIWGTQDGRATICWWRFNGIRHLLVGLDVVEEIVRYTQGDPLKVVTVADKTMWGLADHERPVYLFEDNIVRHSEMTAWADR